MYAAIVSTATPPSLARSLGAFVLLEERSGLQVEANRVYWNDSASAFGGCTQVKRSTLGKGGARDRVGEEGCERVGLNKKKNGRKETFCFFFFFSKYAIGKERAGQVD